MNVTAVAPTGGVIVVWSAGQANPGASSVDTSSGADAGKVTLLLSSGQSHLVADVAGYFVQ